MIKIITIESPYKCWMSQTLEERRVVIRTSVQTRDMYPTDLQLSENNLLR